MSIADDLEYYLDRKPTCDEIADAEEWQTYNPGSSLAEYVDAMHEIGGL